jgi:hypothetical protein
LGEVSTLPEALNWPPRRGETETWWVLVPGPALLGEELHSAIG